MGKFDIKKDILICLAIAFYILGFIINWNNIKMLRFIIFILIIMITLSSTIIIQYRND